MHLFFIHTKLHTRSIYSVSMMSSSVGLAIVYHLEDIRGMSLWYDKFGVLGLSTATVQDAIAAAGSFMLKASELQQ